MPFTFSRDKQKPSDKLGSDDFLSGIRKQFDQDRKMFFDKNPAWENTPSASGFSRGGFFDDERGGRGVRTGIRDHLDDLTQRHPEFASSLRGPAWGAEAGSLWDEQQQPQEHQQHQQHQQQQPSASGDSSQAHADAGPSSRGGGASGGGAEDEQGDEATPLRGRARGMNQTTPDMAPKGGAEGRGQRSWSAPPDSRAPPPPPPARFVSRLDIEPLATGAAAGEPGTQTESSSQQQQPTAKSTSTVHHIPIFVEGRDEPVIPRESAQSSAQKRPFPPGPARSFNTSPQPFRNMEQTTAAGPAKSSSAPNAHTCASKQCPAPKTHDSAPAPAAGPPPDPVMARVNVVAAAVEELRAQVSAFVGGGSRSDKQYVLLDELLTRQLLKLDDVDPAGREDVRSARKQAIRAVQDCISQLEAKVPQPGNEQASSMAVQSEEPAPTAEAADSSTPADAQQEALAPS